MIDILKTDSAKCRGLNNFITLFELDLPANQKITDGLANLTVEIDHTYGMEQDITSQLSTILHDIDAMHNPHIRVDTALFKLNLWGNVHKGMVPYGTPFGKANINIADFLYDATHVDYTGTGCNFEYYIQDGGIFICTQQTARKRLL